jgi:hypothetical protein
MSRLYGILHTSTNTGLDSELAAVFSTPLSIISNQPAFVSDTLTLRRRVSSQDTQRWEIETTLAPTKGDGGFLVNNIRAGYVERVYLRMPQIPGLKSLEVKLEADGRNAHSYVVPKVLNTVVAGSNNITITGLKGYDFAVGEFIQFAGDSKVYVVVDPGIMGSNILVHPNLRSTVYAQTEVTYGSYCTLAARYDPTVALGIKFIDGLLADHGTVKLVEVL